MSPVSDDAAKPIRFIVNVRRLDGFLQSLAIVCCAFVAGTVLRWSVLDHTTPETNLYILPWYRFAHDNGFAGLKEPFTNYASFYSYLLLAASRFDGLAPPLHLIKAISAVFEFGCAVVVAELIWRSTRKSMRAACGFASIWLAPTVFLNGAFWGQADAIWTFFTLLSVSLFARGRNGILPFAIAVAVKAQAVFLGPFILGILLLRRLSWAWLIAVPVVYLALAIPVLVAGRPLSSVLSVYLDQADFYHDLYKGAANPWLFARSLPYDLGVGIGLAIGTLGGLAVAIRIRYARCESPSAVALAACVSLFVMPFLLPKMHDRFFYGFELAAIMLACLDRRYIAFAVLAQLDGLLAYLAFNFQIGLSVPIATIGNIVLSYFLVRAFIKGNHDEGLKDGVRDHANTMGVWLRFFASAASLLVALAATTRYGNTLLIPCALSGTATIAFAMDLLRHTCDFTELARGAAPGLASRFATKPIIDR